MNDAQSNRADTRDAPPQAAPTARLYPMAGLLGDLEADATRRRDSLLTGTPLGALSGFSALDTRLGGCFEVGTHVIHGSPGIGKTAFCLQVAALCKCPALFISCEVLPVELLRRHTARVTGTFLGKFKDGSMTPTAIIELARKAAATAPFLGLLDATNAPAPPSAILEAVETVRRFAPDNPHFLIVLDSLHTWADTLGASGDEYERLNLAVAALRQIAVQEGAAILYTSERNRSSREKGGQSSGAGTRKIEYSGETVIGLQAENTDDDGAPIYDVNGQTPVKAVIGKNRHGEAGSPLPLLFSGRCQQFSEAGQQGQAAFDTSANLRFPKRTNGKATA